MAQQGACNTGESRCECARVPRRVPQRTYCQADICLYSNRRIQELPIRRNGAGLCLRDSLKHRQQSNSGQNKQKTSAPLCNTQKWRCGRDSNLPQPLTGAAVAKLCKDTEGKERHLQQPKEEYGRHPPQRSGEVGRGAGPAWA